MAKAKQSKVRVRKMALGRGVYAAQRLRKGQTAGEVTGSIIVDKDYGSDYCIEMGADRNLEPTAPFRFLNHSCQPNCELFSWTAEKGEDPSVSDRLYVQVLSTIQPGDELTIDYGWPADVAIPCHCGTEGCRGWVVSEEELPVLLRRLKRKPKGAARKKKPASQSKRAQRPAARNSRR